MQKFLSVIKYLPLNLWSNDLICLTRDKVNTEGKYAYMGTTYKHVTMQEQENTKATLKRQLQTMKNYLKYYTCKQRKFVKK